MEINGKKTTLDDDAEIYKRGEDRSENLTTKEKWKTMTKKERRTFFMTYYFWKIMLGLAVVILIGYIIYCAVRPKPNELAYIVVLDNVLNPQMVEDYFEKAVEDMGYTKKEAIINGDTSLSSSNNTPTDAQAISTYIFAGTLDIMIGTEEALGLYASRGVIADIREYLPADILSSLHEDDLVLYHYVPEKDADPNDTERDICIGFRLDGTELIDSTKYISEETGYLLTIIVNGKNVKSGEAYDVIRYMLGLPIPSAS